MKYEVIGWTDFESDLPELDGSRGADNAIVDYIKKTGYAFTGTSHQCQPLCVPVLNDGKKRTYGERAWGAIMAEAHEKDDPNADYMKYAFAFYDDFDEKMPPESERVTRAAAEAAVCDIAEEYLAEVSDGQMERALRERKFAILDSPSLRYLDGGDTLTLCAPGGRKSFTLTEVTTGVDASFGKGEIEPMEYSKLYSNMVSFDEKTRQEAECLSKNARKILLLYF